MKISEYFWRVGKFLVILHPNLLSTESMTKNIIIKTLAFFAITLYPLMSASQVYYNGEKLGTSRIQGGKVGNLAGAYFTIGLAPATYAKVIEGESAEMKITEKRPTFVVKFESKRDSIFADKDNMNELLLVALHEKSNSRRLRTGKYGLVAGVQTDIAQKDVIPVSIEEDEEVENIFTVRPKEELKEGEYAFYYIGKNITQNKVYDFTIKKK